MRQSLLVIIGLVSCTSPDERKAQRASVERSAVSAESATAVVARSLPVTGKWDEPHLVERLVSAGLAPQAVAGAKGEDYWRAPVLTYRVGSATLHAYVYPDSAARRKVTDALDTLTIAPHGAPGPYPIPRLLITNNNLAAVLVGGSERHQERVSNALLAGLPSSDKR
jgi:hypothetical protein